MLVLSRKTRESVVVGGSTGFERILRVTVIEIRGKHVRLGFDIEPDVPVHRLEVWERIFAGGKPTASRGPPEQTYPIGVAFVQEKSSPTARVYYRE